MCDSVSTNDGDGVSAISVFDSRYRVLEFEKQWPQFVEKTKPTFAGFKRPRVPLEKQAA